jgi:hypothetical protein
MKGSVALLFFFLFMHTGADIQYEGYQAYKSAENGRRNCDGKDHSNPFDT